MMLFLAFALATLSPGSSKAIPAFMQAGQLQVLCSIEASQSDAELCSGYILGSVDQVLAEQDIWGRRRAVLCLPADVSADQLRSVIVDHMRENPEQSQFAAATVIAGILTDTYACTPRKGGR